MINDKIPGIVWEQIPKPEVARRRRSRPSKVTNDAIEWIKKHCLELVPK